MTLRPTILACFILALFLGTVRSQEGEIEVPWKIGDMIAHPQMNLVYVINETDGDLLAIDTETGTVSAHHRFEYFSEGSRLFIPHDGSAVWVSLPESQLLQRLHPTNLTTIENIDLEVRVENFVIASDGHLYAINQNASTTFRRPIKVNLSTGTLVAEMTTGSVFTDKTLLRLGSGGDRFYVLEQGASGYFENVEEFEVQAGAVPSSMGKYFSGYSYDKDLFVDDANGRLYKPGGNGVKVWNLSTETQSDWTWASVDGVGVSVAGIPGADTAWALSNSPYFCIVGEFRKSDGNLVQEVPIGEYNSDRNPGTPLAGSLEITPNEHLVYGKSMVNSTDTRYYLGFVGLDSNGLEYVPNNESPAAPYAVTATDGSDPFKVKLTWGRSQRSTSFRIYRSESSDFASASLIASQILPNSFTDVTVPLVGVPFYYWVQAENSAGLSEQSRLPAVGSRMAAPSEAPTSFSATDGAYNVHVVLDWDAVSGAESYLIYRNQSDVFSSSTLLAETTENSFFDSTGTSEITYHYWVVPKNAAGSGPSASDTGSRAFLPVPVAPTLYSAEDGTYQESVSLIYQKAAGTAKTHIFRGTSDNFAEAVEIGTSIGSSYSDRSGVPGQIYYYWVQASNASGTSPPSNSDTGFRALLPPVSGPPAIVQASYGFFGEYIKLTFTSVYGADYHRIYRSETNNPNNAQLVAEIQGRDGTYLDRSATPGIIYYYWITAGNAFGESAFSVSATGLAAIEPPENVYATNDLFSNRVRITWNSVENVGQFKIFRSIYPSGAGAIEIGTTGSRKFEDYSAVAGVEYFYAVASHVPNVGTGSPSQFNSGSRRAISLPGNFFPVDKPRDVEFDLVRNRLYVLTESGVIERIQLGSNIVLSEWDRNASLAGAELTEDGNWMLTGNRRIRPDSLARLELINLNTGSVTAFPFTPHSPVGGGVEVAILQGEEALIAPDQGYSAATPLLLFDLNAGTFSTFLGPGGDEIGFNPVGVRYPTLMSRTFDRRTVFLQEGNISNGPFWRYFADDQFLETANYLDGFQKSGSISPDGGYVVMGKENYAQVFNPYYQLVGTLPDSDAGIAFDWGREILFKADLQHDELKAIRLADFQEIASFPIQNSLLAGYGKYQEGFVTASPDGKWLAINYENGVQLFDISSLSGAPYPPTTIKASDSSFRDRIEITWDAPARADTYEVWRNTIVNPNTATRIAEGITGSSYTDTDTVPGQHYFYWLKSVNGEGTSRLSNYDPGRVFSGPTIISTTENLSVIDGENVTLTVSATSPNGSLTYDWYLGPLGDTSSPLQGDGHQIVLNQLTSNITVWVRVEDIEGAIEALVAEVRTVPRPVDSIVASNQLFTDRVRLSWNPVPGAEEYRIRRGATANFALSSVLQTVAPTNLNWSDFSAVPGITYYYFVTALDAEGDESLYALPSNPLNDGAVANVLGTPRKLPLRTARDLVFSSDSDSLFVVSESGFVDEFSLSSPEPTQFLFAEGHFISLARTPGTDQLIAGSLRSDPLETITRFRVVDIDSGTVDTFDFPEFSEDSGPTQLGIADIVSFVNDHSFLLHLDEAGGSSEPLRHFDRSTEMLSNRFPDGSGSEIASDSRFISNVGGDLGALIELGSPGHWYPYDASSDTFGSAFSLPDLGLLAAASLSPDGQLLAVVFDRSAIQNPNLLVILNRTTGALLHQASFSGIQGVEFSPVMEELYLFDQGSHEVVVLHSGTRVELFRLMLEGQASNESGDTISTAVSPDGRNLAAILADGSVEIIGIPLTLPSLIGGISVTANLFDRITVSWNPDEDASAYRIYRSVTPDFASAQEVASGITATTWSDTEFLQGQAYWYWVVGENARGSGAVAPPREGETTVPPPSALTASEGGSMNAVILTWSSAFAGAEYEIFRSQTNQFSDADSLGQISELSYSDNSVAPGETYWYWLKSKGPTGIASQLSNPVSGWRGIMQSDTPTQTRDIADIHLFWNAIPGVTDYLVYRSNSSASVGAIIATVSELELIDSNTIDGVHYFYRVAGIAGGRTGPLSSPLRAQRTLLPPGSLTGSSDAYLHVLLSWAAVSSAQSYELYRGDSTEVSGASLIATVTGTQFSDESAIPGKNYYYFIRASNPVAGSGFFSAAVAGSRAGGHGHRSETPDLPQPPILTVDEDSDSSSRQSFYGLLRDTTDPEKIVGSFSGGMSRGALSLVIRHEGSTFRGRGLFSEDGSLEMAVSDRSGDSLNLALQLVTSDATGGLRLEGEAYTTDPSSPVATLTAFSNRFHPRGNPAPFASSYTLLIPYDATAGSAPEGDGVGTGVVLPNGRFRFALKFPDGLRVTVAGAASDDGEFAFYLPAYAPRSAGGSLSGNLRVRDVPNFSDFDGTLSLIRPDGLNRPGDYPDGFELTLSAIGSRFSRPVPGVRMISTLTDERRNAEWSVSGGALSEIVSSKPLHWDARNRLLPESNSPAAFLALSTQSGNGFVQGRYRGAAGLNLSLCGVVFQKQNFVSGHFQNGGRSGLMTIVPIGLPRLKITDVSDSELAPDELLDFGAVGIEGGSLVRHLAVSNTGDGNLFLQGLPRISGAGADAFNLMVGDAGSLAPGESTLFSIVAAPPTEGSFPAEITFLSNDRNSNPFVLRLAVTGSPGSGVAVQEALPQDLMTPSDVQPGDQEALDSLTESGEFRPEHAGIYAGMLFDEGTACYALINVRPNGLFSGILKCGSRRASFAGVVAEDGRLSLSRWSGQLSDQAQFEDLQLAEGSDPDNTFLVGGFRNLDSGALVPIRFGNTKWATTPPVEGKHTLVIPSPGGAGNNSPQGSSTATVTIRPNGTVLCKLMLADGENHTLSARLTRELRWEFERSKGFTSLIGSVVHLETPGVSDSTGSLQWQRQPNPRARNFRDGFRFANLAIVGSNYTPASGGTRSLAELGEIEPNGNLMLSNFADKPVIWTNRNLISLDADPDGGRLVGTRVIPGTGMVVGSYLVPSSETGRLRRIILRGVVFQKQGLVDGASLEGSETGHFGISPN
ncbi:MAG: hypothetical protein KDN20_06565 [Verrucomicrobiae bacterium]|nr:hypothetical protein [Verrucomicrobiae bacterium]